MKFCTNCGSRIDENAIFCPNCGARVNGEKTHTNNGGYDPYGTYRYPIYDTQPSLAVAIISFVFWQAGLITWLFCRTSRPGKARSAAKGLLANICFSLPIVGAIIYALWRKDGENADYAKVAGISAIVGGAFYLVLIIAMIATGGFANLTFDGDLDELIPGVSAFINDFIRMR